MELGLTPVMSWYFPLFPHLHFPALPCKSPVTKKHGVVYVFAKRRSKTQSFSRCSAKENSCPLHASFFLGGEDMIPRLDENNSTHMGEEPPHIISSRCGNGRAGRLKSGGLDPSILAPFRLQRRPKKDANGCFHPKWVAPGQSTHGLPAVHLLVRS